LTGKGNLDRSIKTPKVKNETIRSKKRNNNRTIEVIGTEIGTVLQIIGANVPYL